MNATSRRTVIVSTILVASSVYLAHASRSELVPIHESLEAVPMQLAEWEGHRQPPMEQRIVGLLGVDEYVDRVYVQRSGPIGLYIGYYQSQREGDTIHSPLNCLPGAGWLPVSQRRIKIPVQSSAGSREIEVNRFIIEKGLDRQVVLYWYQSHARIVASEYWGKIYMVMDAIRLNRTDGALVRVVSPIIGSDSGAEIAAESRAVEFVNALFPTLSRYLPS